MQRSFLAFARGLKSKPLSSFWILFLLFIRSQFGFLWQPWQSQRGKAFLWAFLSGMAEPLGGLLSWLVLRVPPTHRRGHSTMDFHWTLEIERQEALITFLWPLDISPTPLQSL